MNRFFYVTSLVAFLAASTNAIAALNGMSYVIGKGQGHYQPWSGSVDYVAEGLKISADANAAELCGARIAMRMSDTILRP